MKDGIYPDISNEGYHNGPGVSKSDLDAIAKSPAHYKARKDHPKPSTLAMEFGTQFHDLVLDPDLFNEKYCVEPINAARRPNDRQRNAKKPSPETIESIQFWDRFEENNKGKTIISNKPGADPYWSSGDWDKLHKMRDSIEQHEIARLLLDRENNENELSAYWVDPEYDLLRKCRPDCINYKNRIILDLKTTDDASPEAFARSVAKYRYHVQQAWYMDIIYELGLRYHTFLFVAIEKTPPYNVAVYQLDNEAIYAGKLTYQRDLATLAQCIRTDHWPGYEPIQELSLPPWALSKED